MTITTDHEEIKNWIKKHKGKPEILNGGETSVALRVNFPGTFDDMYLSEDNPPTDTSWEEFFKIFEAQDLAFEYDEAHSLSDPSSAFHFIRRDFVDSE